jgi:hypothetical protein
VKRRWQNSSLLGKGECKPVTHFTRGNAKKNILDRHISLLLYLGNKVNLSRQLKLSLRLIKKCLDKKGSNFKENRVLHRWSKAGTR